MITIVCSYCGEHKQTEDFYEINQYQNILQIMDLTNSFIKKGVDYDAKCLKCWEKEEEERRKTNASLRL